MDYYLAYVRVLLDPDKDGRFPQKYSTTIYPILVEDDQKLLNRVIGRARSIQVKGGTPCHIEVHVGDYYCDRPDESFVDIASDMLNGRVFEIDPFQAKGLVEQVGEELVQLYEDAVRAGVPAGDFGNPDEMF